MDVAMDDATLLTAWQEHGDQRARAVLVERMLPLAHGLARRYMGKGEPLDDLEQVACVGLLKAIDRFDPSRDVRFSTFAVPTIAGELKRHFRDKGWMLHVPRDVQELHHRLATTRETLTAQLGRSPTVGELGESARASVEQVVEALGAGSAYRLASLDAPSPGGGDEGVVEGLGEPDEGFERTEQRLLLGRGMMHLAPREREILRLRFFEGLTQREIAREVGISQMHVSRLLRRAVDALRDVLEPPALAA